MGIFLIVLGVLIFSGCLIYLSGTVGVIVSLAFFASALIGIGFNLIK